MIEGIVAVPAGLLAGLVSVIGFGFDSAIEVIAVVLVAFRLSALLRHGVADERKNDSCCPWSRFPNRLLSPSRCACRGCVIALPAAEVGRGDTGDERGAQQPGGRVDERTHLRELFGHNGVGLGGGQYPIHILVGDAHRQRSGAPDLGQTEIPVANCQAAPTTFAVARK